MKLKLSVCGSCVLSVFSSVAVAGFVPDEWEDSKGGILQLYGEGQYFYQSNNLVNADLTVMGGEDFNIMQAPNPGEEWGYRASLGFIFPSKRFDLRGGYWNVRENTTTHSFQPLSTVTLNSTQRNIYEFQAADLTLGQYICPVDGWWLRIGYGAAYANIKQEANGKVFANSTEFSGTIETPYSNTFEGIGPKLSLDSLLDLNDNFSLAAGVGAAVLFGHAHSKYYAVPSFFPAEVYDDEKEDRSVFAADAKLGLVYNKVLSDHMAINIEAGYRAAYYVNALEQPNTHVRPVPQADVDLQGSNHNYYNYGPYAGIGLDFK